MAIAVFKVWSVIDRELVDDGAWPARCAFRPGDLAAVLTNLPNRADEEAPPGWELAIDIGSGVQARRVMVPLQPFLTGAEYQQSQAVPISFAELAADHQPPLFWAWLYRDGIYVTERTPKPSEIGEVILRIKLLQFQGDEMLKRLKEQVANFEAIENIARNAGDGRKPIPDDVKLLVWSRDGGVCVRCGAAKDLHFDHIIPFSRGGSDESENIQLLCRTCNLTKSARLV